MWVYGVCVTRWWGLTPNGPYTEIYNTDNNPRNTLTVDHMLPELEDTSMMLREAVQGKLGVNL
jgi:hypothetical protein